MSASREPTGYQSGKNNVRPEKLGAREETFYA